ncbi:MAG: glutamate--cysteine ligase [Candidatus Margulisbacteria bacterium]|nr:glutamate--cysteine ligase [Candidatus Margulisiibacteriota bacterium]
MINLTQTTRNLTESDKVTLEKWLEQKSKGLTYPIYASMDLRISSDKAAVVDTNLFPSGFNNLCETMINKSAQYLAEYIKQYFSGVKKVAVFCEAHTRNLFYFQNLKALGQIINKAGFESYFVHPEIEGTIEGIYFSQKYLKEADLLINNNDFSSGYPQLLQQLTIPVIPGKELIWAKRRKSRHFSIIRSLSVELAEKINIDPWFISAEFEFEQNINLKEKASLERLKQKAELVLERTRRKYREYQISTVPTIFIKDDAGTYGMGIMTIQNIDELDNLNSKKYNKMSVGKQHIIKDLLVQEGIPSSLQCKGAVAEPVIYCIGQHFIGAFLRVNQLKNEMANLNSKGMEFFRICNEDIDHLEMPDECQGQRIIDDLGMITIRVALLAAATENSAEKG